MSTIRKRDDEYVQGQKAGYNGAYHPDKECPADRDRRVLLAAGDAMAQMLQMQHSVSPTMGLDGEVALIWCGGCDKPESECWAVPVIAAWNEATG